VSSTSGQKNGPLKVDTASKVPEQVEMSLPKYLVDAHYTVRAKNISIKELDGDRRYFTLSKLLVREFQYGKNSAFELNIPISITHKNKRYSSDLWLFGDVTPQPKHWVINYRGEFKTKETVEGFQYDDLVIDGKSIFNPNTVDLTSAIELLVEKKKVGTGEITAKYDQLQFHLKFSEFPMDFLNMVGDEIKNPFWQKISGTGEGEVRFNRVFSKENISSLSAKLHFPGQFTLGPDHNIPGQWFLDFKNEIWETSFISPKQDLKFSRRAILDFGQGQVTQYSQEIGFTSCELKTALLAVQPLASLMAQATQPYHSTVVLFKQCLDGDKIFDGSFRYGVYPDQKYYQAELQNNQSKMLLKYAAREPGQDLSLELTNFSWNSTYKFMEPFMSASQGFYTGKLEGKWNSHWSDGTWLLKMKADEVKDEAGEFFNLNQRMWDYFTLDSSGMSNKNWMASVNKQTIKLNSFILGSTEPAHIPGNFTSLPKM